MTAEQLKQTLLKTNLFFDNDYLTAYIDLILKHTNYSLQELADRMFDESKCYQYHHVIPVNFYNSAIPDRVPQRKRAFYARKLATCDSNNFTVSLHTIDHIVAHYLLSKCEIKETTTYVNKKAMHILITELTQVQLSQAIESLTNPLFTGLRDILLNKLNPSTTPEELLKPREKQQRCRVNRNGIYKNILLSKLSDYLDEGWHYGSSGMPRYKKK